MLPGAEPLEGTGPFEVTVGPSGTGPERRRLAEATKLAARALADRLLALEVLDEP